MVKFINEKKDVLMTLSDDNELNIINEKIKKDFDEKVKESIKQMEENKNGTTKSI